LVLFKTIVKFVKMTEELAKNTGSKYTLKSIYIGLLIVQTTYSEQVDNDASIDLNEQSLCIREFSFRADLREKNVTFLKNMIALGVENNWLFFDRKGKIMKPDFEEIKTSIRNSNAYRFLENPIKFFRKYSQEQ